MKIVYSGGYNKYHKYSVVKSLFYRYADVVNKQIDKGKVVASINFAKPDFYYDSRLDEVFGGKVIRINNRNKAKVNWSEYDIIFIPGGNPKWLKEGLLETGFSLEILKEDVVIIGDSAGAYVMGKYFPTYDGKAENIDDRNIQEYAEEGFCPESNALVGIYEINMMNKSVIIANTTREEITDKSAILSALDKILLAGYGIVTAIMQKVERKDPYLKYPNVIINPHNEFNTIETNHRVNKAVIENILNFI